jgi:hypothetical protein
MDQEASAFSQEITMCFNYNEKLLLTIKEFCFLCHIGQTKFREEVKAERIKTIPIGRRGVRIHVDEVGKWIEYCKNRRRKGKA